MGGRNAAAAALAVAALLALAACSGHENAGPAAMIYSPNGEPLSGGPLGHPTCRTALSGWFDRLAAGHGNALDLALYLADARRQFAVMDLDKDGLITPAELATYRAPYTDAERANLAEAYGTSSSGFLGHILGGEDRPQEQADPVMSADVALNNQVGLTEFLAYERREFASLDTHHAGRLNRADILTLCTD